MEHSEDVDKISTKDGKKTTTRKSVTHVIEAKENLEETVAKKVKLNEKKIIKEGKSFICVIYH